MRRVYLGAMVGALASLGFAQPVLAANPVEPLNQYIVTGTDAELKTLGALGYDVAEGADAPGRTGIVATPAQADQLEAKGYDIAPIGVENTARRTRRSPRASRSPIRPGATTSSGRTRSSRRRARRRAPARSTPPARP